MTTAFQNNAFQINAFQIDVSGVPGALPTQLDQGGFMQGAYVDRGPSLGLSLVRVMPQIRINALGSYALPTISSVVLINVADFVTILLPQASLFCCDPADQSRTEFGGGILIKDLGGHAAAFNVTVLPFTGDTIDGLGGFSLSTNFAVNLFRPLNDLSGWWVV